LAFVIGALGCTVRFIAPYDQKIDDGVTNLQKMTTEFLTTITSKGGSGPEDYKDHIKFYDDTHVALSGIRLRTEAVPQNEKTSEQLKVLEDMFEKMRREDKEGGIKLEVASSKANAFDRIFRAILTLELAKKDASS
jgi:hypothetical protein